MKSIIAKCLYAFGSDRDKLAKTFEHIVANGFYAGKHQMGVVSEIVAVGVGDSFTLNTIECFYAYCYFSFLLALGIDYGYSSSTGGYAGEL